MAFAYSPKIVTDGLVLYLDAANPYSYVSGSAIWNDLSRSQLSGSLINGPTFSTGSGGSIVFDGIDDYASFQSIDLSSTDKITVSFWCKIVNYRQVTGSNNIVLEVTTNFNSSTTGLYVGFGDDSTSLWNRTYPISVNLKGNTGYNISGFNKNLVDDLNWHHWTCLFDKSITGSTPQETFLYIDGNYQTPTIIPSAAFRSNNTNNFGNNPLFLGARSTAEAPSNAQVSNLQVYSRILSADEVLQNYNATKTRFGL